MNNNQKLVDQSYDCKSDIYIQEDRDYLTKLPNRFSFERTMKAALSGAEIEKMGYAILVDINDFRMINQGFGYDTGDSLIINFARFLTSAFDSTYTIFRISSDSFILLCAKLKQDNQLEEDIERIISRSHSPWPIGAENLYCTVSISAVYYPMNGRTVEDIYRNLDSALYKAQEIGKNNFMIYQEEFENIANIVIRRSEIEKMLRNAVNDDFLGFKVYYQPIYNSTNDTLMGAEALIRYFNKDGLMFPPNYFISLAEKTGLILPLGEYVLKTAARFCRSIIDAGHPDFYVTVNVSVHQWQSPDFFQTVTAIIDESGVPAENIVLEITEGIAASNIEQIQDTCRQLRARGTKIALDDFGTGYSSLNMIRTMPIDLIKIDRAFINDVTLDQYTHVFMRLITELGHLLGIVVCAEGIEQKEQLQCCRDIGVDLIQGFLFNKALPEHEFRNVMAIIRQQLA